MKPQKHKTAVRIFCLIFAVLMIVSLLSSVIFTLSHAPCRRHRIKQGAG